MADFIFHKNTGLLQHGSQQWPAVSGGGRYQALQSKIYHVPANSLMSGTDHSAGVPYNSKYAHKAFKDINNFGWFQWLGEAGLGIHPDGNVPGTEGCIGIKTPNTRALFDLLKQFKNRSFTLEVK